MDFHQLRIFSEVYRQGSFTRAAEALHISQPTISEHIKNLEAELSASLFDRLGRSIIPTTTAEVLFPRAQQLLDSLHRLHDDLVRARDEVRGAIVLGASTIPGTYIIPARVVAFSRLHPEVTFEVIIEDTAKITQMILDHQLFCGIVGARTFSEKLSYQTFVRDELVLVGRPELCPKHGCNAAKLRKLPFLLREKGSGTRSCMEEHFAGIGIYPGDLNEVAILGSTAAIKEAVRQGLGVSVLSRLAVREELENGSLKEIAVAGLQMSRDFFLVRHNQRTLPAHYQAFYSHLQEAQD
ncbi:MAG: LysR family transcriptional regulator [Desulfobulbaceae bacterium]|nr:LysR family transcriptional regulator [Desulfobulbaceae bacterium]